MKKRYWLVVGIISLIIGLIIHFNEIRFRLFLSYTIVSSTLIFGFIYSTIKLLENRKNKKKLRYISLLVFVIILFFAFHYHLIYIKSHGVPSGTPNHFRTNIITGKCDFGGGSAYKVSNPWYYQRGCDLPVKEIVDILKNEEFYKEMVNWCENNCINNDSSLYCSKEDLLPSIHDYGLIICDDLIDCEKITCD